MFQALRRSNNLVVSCCRVVNTLGNKQSNVKFTKKKDFSKAKKKGFTQPDDRLSISFPTVTIDKVSKIYKEQDDIFNILLPSQVPAHVCSGYRNLNALRRCQRFDEMRVNIRNSLDRPWVPTALIEAMRGLVEAKVYGKAVDEDLLLSTSLKRCCEGSLPVPVMNAINILDGLLHDSQKLNITENKLNVIFIKEIERLCALIFLVDGNWLSFKKFVEQRSIDMTEPIFLFWLWKLIEKKKVKKKECISFILDKCVLEERLLCADNFSTYFGPFLSSFSKLTKARISEDGLVEDKYQISSKTFLEKDVTHLHKDLLDTLEDLSDKGGSLVKNELKSLNTAVFEWKKRAIVIDGKFKALVVDSLNLTPSNENSSFQNLIYKVAKDYGNCFFVIRRHLLPMIPKNIPGNVEFFVCNANAEDDLFVLYAALTWGLDAEILSNDNFEAHVARVKITGPLTLRNWIKQCVIKFERGPREYVFANRVKSKKAVEKLDDGVYLLPTQDKTDVTILYHLIKLRNV